MPRDATTRALLDKYVLLRVDVNQLNGGFQAQRFNIVRVPTLMVLSPDGREQRRLPVISNQTKADAVLEVLRGA
jgi:thiol:disulfide interchange protein